MNIEEKTKDAAMYPSNIGRKIGMKWSTIVQYGGVLAVIVGILGNMETLVEYARGGFDWSSKIIFGKESSGLYTAIEITQNTLLKAGMIRAVPGEFEPDDDRPRSASEIVGACVRVSLHKGQLILWSHIDIKSSCK